MFYNNNSVELYAPNVTIMNYSPVDIKLQRYQTYSLAIGLSITIILLVAFINSTLKSGKSIREKHSKGTPSNCSAHDTTRSISEATHNRMDADIPPVSVSLSQISYLNKGNALLSQVSSYTNGVSKISMKRNKNNEVFINSFQQDGDLVPETIAYILSKPNIN